MESSFDLNRQRSFIGNAVNQGTQDDYLRYPQGQQGAKNINSALLPGNNGVNNPFSESSTAR
jgi:hypothetical protein